MFYCQLGYLKFQLTTYFTGHEYTKNFGFSERQRIQGKSRMQAIGDALDTRTLDMRFHWLWCDPRASVTKLEEVAARKEAQSLTFGDGTYEGRFVVTAIVGTHQHENTDGQVLWIDARITLKEWVDDDPAVTAKRQKIAQAPARRRNGVVSSHKVQHGTPAFTSQTSTPMSDFNASKIARQS